MPDRPAASTPAVRARMRAQATRDTAPELALRRRLHARGLRYRVDHPIPVPRRRADVVFTRRRLAVFVDRCWWHGCPDHHRAPSSNTDWWAAKVASNRARDADTDRRLAAAGWDVVRAWEHDDPELVADRVEDALAE